MIHFRLAFLFPCEGEREEARESKDGGEREGKNGEGGKANGAGEERGGEKRRRREESSQLCQ